MFLGRRIDQGTLIRPMRGKAATTKSSPQLDRVDELEDLALKLSDRLTALEKNDEADKEDDRKLVTRIANLELQMSRMKRLRA